MFFLIGLAHKLLKLGIVLALITILGQVPIKGQSLENRYHRFVNSHSFQKSYWTVVRPVTWTSEKVVKLFKKTPELNSQTR